MSEADDIRTDDHGAPRRHSPMHVNMEVCAKCGMTRLAQVYWPRRACRPRVSKRRLKIKFWRSVGLL